MSGNDRGMMKWAPYKSLIEQEDALKRAKHLKEKIDKPILTDDAIEEINNLLVSYHKQSVTVFFWINGYIEKESGIISNIDATFKQLRINRKLIDFSSIIGIEEN